MAASAGLVPWNDAEVSSVTTEDIIWRLDECKDYLETATFLVYLADASLLFIQVVISSVGLYRHEPAINVKHIVDRARQATWAVKFSKKDIVLDDNGATLKLQANTFAYDAATGSYRVLIPAQAANTVGEIDLTFAPAGPSMKASGGRVWLDEGKFMSNVFPLPRATVTGKVSFAGAAPGARSDVNARGFVSRLFQNVKGHEVASLWSLCKFDSERATTIIVSFRTPNKHGKQWVNLACLIVDGDMVCVTTDVEMILSAPVKDADTGYNVPQHTRYTLRGSQAGVPGVPVVVELDLAHETLVDKVDLLAQLPWLLRMAVRAFIAAPWVYRYWDETTINVRVGDDLTAYSGRVLREYVFLNHD